jgi:hypothetical protein
VVELETEKRIGISDAKKPFEDLKETFGFFSTDVAIKNAELLKKVVDNKGKLPDPSKV